MRKKELSEAKRQIIEQCQVIGFGRLAFRVKNGVRDPAYWSRTRRTVKLAGGGDSARQPPSADDFELCREQVALLETLASLPDGTPASIEIRHGLPFLVEIEQEQQVA